MLDGVGWGEWTGGPDGPPGEGSSTVASVMERAVASFDGTRIWLADDGGDGPVVLLLHGATVTSTTNFAIHLGRSAAGRIEPTPGPTIASALRDAGARVVVSDARGHGRSGRSSDPDAYRGDSHARDAMAVIDSLEVSEIDVVGYSMGAITAARLLGLEPRLRAVALCGIGPDDVEGAPDEPYELTRLCGECFQADSWTEHPELRPYRAAASLDPIHDFGSIGAALIGLEPVPGERLAATTVPVLVVNGAGDDRDGNAATLASSIPGAVARVAGEGDHVMAPSDPVFQAAVVSFLRARWPGRR